MELKVKKLEESDIPTVDTWWEASGYGPMPFHAFPKNAYLVSIGEKPIVVGSVAFTDSPVVYMDNIGSNPSSTKSEREDALFRLFTTLVAAAKENGFKYWSAHSSLKEMGDWSKKFKETQRGENHYWFTGEL